VTVLCDKKSIGRVSKSNTKVFRANSKIQIQNFAPIISEKNYEKKAHCEVHHEAITTNNIETWRLSQGIINIMQISLPLEKC